MTRTRFYWFLVMVLICSEQLRPSSHHWGYSLHSKFLQVKSVDQKTRLCADGKKRTRPKTRVFPKGPRQREISQQKLQSSGSPWNSSVCLMHPVLLERTPHCIPHVLKCARTPSITWDPVFPAPVSFNEDETGVRGQRSAVCVCVHTYVLPVDNHLWSCYWLL